MIDALIAGKLYGTPTQRTSRNGNHFTTARIRVPTGEDAVICNVIAFDQDAQNALLALDVGEPVSLCGSLKVGVWTDRQGDARPTIDVTASKVLTTYSVAKRRKAMSPAGQPQHEAQDGLDDGEPLDF